MEIFITLPMPKYLEQYLCNFLQRKNKRYYLSRANDVGKFINSLISYPDGSPESEEGVRVVIPQHSGVMNPHSRNFITKENQRRLIDHLSSKFDFELSWWAFKAHTTNMQFNTAYEVFMKAKGIDWDARNLEALKKKEYRIRVKIELEYKQAMQSLVG